MKSLKSWKEKKKIIPRDIQSKTDQVRTGTIFIIFFFR